MRSIILMYHDIYSDIPASHIPRSAAMYHISKQSFIKHLAMIKESKLRILKVSELLDRKKIPLSGSTSFLNNKNDHSILFGINNLKEYLKSKKIEIR